MKNSGLGARASGARRAMIAALAAATALVIPGAAQADEPYARSRDYDMTHARIHLRFEIGARKVMGDATETLTILRAGITSVAVDSVNLTIESVALGDKPAQFKTTTDKLIVTLPGPAVRGQRFDVRIQWSGQPKKGLYFVLPDANYPDRPREVWTQGEAEDTRYYIPIYDYPNDRMTTEMLLTVPSAWQTISNGRLASVKTEADGSRTWDWRQEEPHSSYLITVVAGEFEEVDDVWRGIPLRFVMPRGQGDRVPVTFENTREMLEFFSNALGVRYPWAQYAQTAVDDFVEGGMENTSATTLTIRGMQHPELVKESVEASDGLLSHELAHQWFGDLVTCKDWGNVWLNEGFASYFETLWIEHKYGKDQADYDRWRAGRAWMDSGRNYPAPIVYRDSDNSLAFAGNEYDKASWVLHMLRHELGDTEFFASLKHYLEANRGKNVVTADLARAIEEATATNVDQFFDEWIYHAGAPRFRVRYTYDDAAHQVKLEVKQTQTIEGQVGLFRMPVTVEVVTAEGKTSQVIDVSKAEETFAVPASSRPLLVLFDKGNYVLKSLDFEKSPAEWIYQLKHAETVPDRADAAIALGHFRDNDDVLAALGEAATQDAFWGVRVEALRSLGAIGGPSAEGKIEAALANEQPWVREEAVTQLGRFAEDAGLSVKLEQIFRGDSAYHVRAAALRALAERKAPEALNALTAAVQTESPDDILRNAALRAFGALGDDHAVPILVEWSSLGRPSSTRTAAISSLGRLDKKNKDIEQRLLGYLNEPYTSIQFATVFALGQRGDAAAIPALEAYAKNPDLSPMRKDFALRQIASLRNGGKPLGGGPATQGITNGTDATVLDALGRLTRMLEELNERVGKLEDLLNHPKK